MDSILELSCAELEQRLKEWGQPSYRARQIWTWLYQRLAASFDEMSDLPRDLRRRLHDTFAFGRLVPVDELESSDGRTRKLLFQLPDGAQIESVLMAYDKRQTVCVSTQAGCAMGCSFCATGQAGFQRNLTAGEIVEQVLYFGRRWKVERGKWQEPSTFYLPPSTFNLVFMGMGEPFANYENWMRAARRLNDPSGLNVGARRMTVSTVGLIPGIEKLAGEDFQINLAVSLHAATDELRDRLVPINRRYPLAALMEAVRGYIERTHRRVSFEWALIENVNDTPDQARALAGWLEGLLCHVNLIPLNPSSGYAGAASPRARIEAFRAILDRAHIPNTLRLRRGIDIQAGCGQLRQRRSFTASGLSDNCWQLSSI